MHYLIKFNRLIGWCRAFKLLNVMELADVFAFSNFYQDLLHTKAQRTADQDDAQCISSIFINRLLIEREWNNTVVIFCYNLLFSILLQLLTRVFATMMDKNPSYVAGEKRKFIMRPPQVFKIGTKKTSFANFGDICKM